ncbi:MAG: phosphoribosylaminoimidazolesuccinocarboxamide synthase [Candidatus Promineifilaceae bacterium]
MLTSEELIAAIPGVLRSCDLPGLGPKLSGKVRDIYQRGGQRLLVTTDRVSAFDRVLGAIPFKGQVLNQLSAWWFEQTADIVPNHVIAVPDPNVTVAIEAETLPVEVVVRGYISGVTSTSLWTLYEQGERRPYGALLPEGLKKDDPLPWPMITPTTKAESGAHDERLSREEIIERGLVAEELWEEVEAAALALFAHGQAVAADAGLILVDTKYEFGLVGGDMLALIDEIHTPDSSRFWTQQSYRRGQPTNVDKEYLRRALVDWGYQGEGPAPELPDELVANVAALYIYAFESLTGQRFEPGAQPAVARIAANLGLPAVH